jgi:uncharacterized protein YcbK (DUF882 family)
MTNKQRQLLLAYLGYYVGEIDGDWGTLSKTACKAFQKDFGGISVDGYGGPETDKALKHAVAYGMPAKNIQDSEKDEKKPIKSFWDEIEYFTRDEFKCKCGGKYCNGFPSEPDERMVRIVDQLRKNLGVPVTIVSGLRCKTWNAIQGGVINSQHMYGEAADIYASGVSQSRVEAELDKIGGVRYHYAIKNSSNVHFDVPKGNR